MTKIWKYKQVEENKARQLSQSAQISPLIAKLLLCRGIENASQTERFLSYSEEDISNPFLFAEMRIAVDRILHAVKGQERVLIYGDYDVDGVTATCIMLETLWGLGLQADYILPNRFIEGYGLQVESIKKVASEYDLLITVDCGATAHEAIDLASKLDLDVIVTDHHESGQQRPPAHAILNPNCIDESYPFKGLSGAGVAWKLATAIRMETGRMKDNCEQMELAGLGTITDMMPLLGENRVILAKAIDRLAHVSRPGLMALMELSHVVPSKISARDLGFRLGPRLNAAGRMEHPRLALELLMTRDETRACELAQYLHTLNSKRRSVESKIFEEACACIEKQRLNTQSDKILVVTGQNWHRGVLGIVSQRLMQRFNKPVFLLSIEDDIAYGSARSMEGASLIPILEQVRSQTISCGGHAAAAGIKVRRDSLEACIKGLRGAAECVWTEIQPSTLWIDSSIPLEQIDDSFMADISRLEPFGQSNEEPVFSAKGSLGGYGAKIVGNDHLRLTLQHPRGVLTAIGFGQGRKIERLDGKDVEIAFSCQYEEYQGRRNIKLHLHDIRSSSHVPEMNTRPTSESVSFFLERETLGRIYRLLRDSANEEKRLDSENASLFAELVKISRKEFELALQIFTELDLLVVERGYIVMKEVISKKDLSDSSTFRAMQAETKR